MRRTIAVCILLMLVSSPLLSALAAEGEEVMFLPYGVWEETEALDVFITQSITPLTESQQQIAEREGIAVSNGALPEGTAMTPEQLRLLYPDADELLGIPAIQTETAGLAMFGLNGEWFYGEDDVLYYRHEEGHALMTVDEVFAALSGDEPVSGDEKVIYLTIDDAPSHYTMELLAVLDSLDVKATFFVVGAYVKNRPVFMRAIYEQGHAIANHSYSHDAEILGSSFQACLNDFRRCEQAVRDVLGFELAMPILRVPYGASTIPVGFRAQLQENGYLWIDWNALNGDTESTVTSDKAALDRAYSTASRYDGSIVMLVHDGKKRTIRTLPEMVEHFREQGYEFRVLTEDIGKIPGVRMGLPKQ